MRGYGKMTRQKKIVRRLAFLSALLALSVALAACASGAAPGAGTGGAAASSGSGSASGATSAGGLSSLPTSVQQLYANISSDTPVGATPLATFKARHKPPWVIGYSSEYAGNNWRAAALNRLFQTLLPEYKKAGLVSKVIVDQSNLNNELQIQQIEQMVNQGVDAIITCCAGTTVLNGAIAYAHSHGVPFFVFNGYVTSPYAISEEGNYYEDGVQMATTLFKDMGGKGNFLNVIGFPGIASNDSVEAGLQTALKSFPAIHSAGSVTSLDTDSQAKQVVLQFLANHPGQINGVFTQSPGEMGVLQALLQSGRSVMPITVGGETGPECYWEQHPNWVSDGYNVWPPGDDFEVVWDIMIRTLEGQGPRIQTFVHPTQPFTQSDASAAAGGGCSLTGDAFTQPGMSTYFPQSLMNEFFAHPSNPLTYKA
jgi:ribose transport system substrate-binding protein